MDEADQAQVMTDLYFRGAMNAHDAARPRGASLMYCEDCGRRIPAARRLAVPGCTRCIECQADLEKGGPR